MSISVNFLYGKNHFYFSYSCFVFILSACSKFQDSSHVIFIALNGLEAYCMDKAEMPITRKLMEQECSTLKKRSDLLSSSAVNWAAMFTGSSPEIHGYMQWNSKIPEILSRVILQNRIFLTVFQFIRKQSPSAEIGCVYEWSIIKYVIDNRSFNYEEQAKSSEEVNPTICQMAEKYIRERSPDLFAIIFDELDHIGHQVGYNTEEYYVKVTELYGYIAQVWTGTSAEPNYFNAEEKERVFETAYLEYGCMEAMTAPTGRKMFFLTDPIEDREFDWAYYKQNYQATFTAQLLYPEINNYEVMPWPDRIYKKLSYTSEQLKKGGGIAGSYNLEVINPEIVEKKEKALIPRSYSTQMQVMINSLNQMPVSSNKLSGSQGISVLMGNSLMFQRSPDVIEGYDDPQLSNFYGEALPFLKRGVPIKTVHVENLSYPETLKETKELLMTYSNLKPLSEVIHAYLEKWVISGGVIVYSSIDSDPFQTVQEWWNQNGYNYERPSDHLFHLLGIGSYPEEGEYLCGKETVYIIRKDLKEYMLVKGGDDDNVAIVKELYERKDDAGKLVLNNNFYLERGLYNVIAVLDEDVSKEPYHIQGLFIDLFDDYLSVLTNKTMYSGEQSFLMDINRIEDKMKPQILAAASRTYNEKRTKNSYSFITKSPLNTISVMRILLPSKPKLISVTNSYGNGIINATWQWEKRSKTYLLRFKIVQMA